MLLTQTKVNSINLKIIAFNTLKPHQTQFFLKIQAVLWIVWQKLEEIAVYLTLRAFYHQFLVILKDLDIQLKW